MVLLSNSKPLIYLSKMGELNPVKSLFAEINVAAKVFEEVVVQGAGKPGSDEVQSDAWIKRQPVFDKNAVQKLRDDELLGVLRFNIQLDVPRSDLSLDEKNEWLEAFVLV